MKSIGLALAAALVVTGTALAATTAKNPSSLILRKGDMPRGADYEATTGDDIGLSEALEAKGIDASAASYLGISYSKAQGSWQISGVVIVTGSVAQGKQAFTTVVKERAAFRRSIRARFKPLTLPSFGDQQSAVIDPAGSEGISAAELVVRRKTVVWLLYVISERRPAIPQAQYLAEVKKYAAKQRLRVGSG